MRKLTILKSIIDFVWILSCIPILIFGLGLVIYIFFNADFLSVMEIEGFNSDLPLWLKQITVLIFYIIACSVIYALFLFRKTLRYFQKRKPFHSYVINTYNTIGKILVVIGLCSMLMMLTMSLISSSKLVIGLGVSPYLVMIALGLFFMVLSELFRVAREAKQDSELSI
ncbi:DUF2975 domain-containing protein [Bizionia sp. KMM 8389]